MQGTKERFTAWVAQQDPEAEYNFCDSENCAFAQFEKAEGSYHGPRKSGTWTADDSPTLPRWTEGVLNPTDQDWSFGALLKRLREHDGNAPAS